jgi:type III restriction enzyme
LELFLDYAARFPDLRQAFNQYWKDKGVRSVPDYKNNVRGVPHVCIKVPTAGGKTFIAANAVRPIFDALTKVNPTRPQVVIWLVPSLTILDQTIKSFNDPSHPYRQKLNTHFNGRVAVYNKQDILQGANFSPDAVKEQLSVIVLSFDSLRTANKEGRKVYQENGYLAAFASAARGKDFVLPDTDETALINVLRAFEPVLVVDESHNAETGLSVKMLQDLNPSFILDLTATPRDNSNIISYVDALELKKQNMVKLPVIVNNFKDKNDVIASALQLRRKLEEAAKAEEAAGGKPIRPIVLFQAQTKAVEENTTFEKIKEQLIALDIPEAEIKIKTAEINELKGIDLMDADCQVRYIITINALKEGWDCPFAYILASLANKTSPVDVEQILGRVLRQPYVRTHAAPILNTSYVFTASGNFQNTLIKIVEGLNRAGFSEKDFRSKDMTAEIPTATQPILSDFDFLGGTTTTTAPSVSDEGSDEIDVTKIKDASGTINQTVENIIEITIEQNMVYQQQADSVDETEFVPTEIKDRMNVQPMKETFAEEARKIILPQFYLKIKNEGSFLDDEEFFLLENDELLKDFRLSQQSTEIQFENLPADTYIVDLERLSDENYKPEFKKMKTEQRNRFNEFILSLPDESKIKQVNAHLCKLIGKIYPIHEKEIKGYVQRILDAMPVEQLQDCLERDYTYSERIKEKIKALGNVRKEEVFNTYLDIDKIAVKPTFTLPPTITPSSNASDITKSLYAHEESMNGFEFRVINDIANLENIAFWHRNLEKSKGFRINGFVNHYPDFIVVSKRGKILIIETKGDDRDNSDSAQKVRLGEKWANKAGNDYKYMMIFDNQYLAGAYRINDAFNLIAQM